MSECPHDSMSGDEGPVALLGRMPVRWRCETCGAIVHDDSAVRCAALALRAALSPDRAFGVHHTADGQETA